VEQTLWSHLPNSKRGGHSKREGEWGKKSSRTGNGGTNERRRFTTLREGTVFPAVKAGGRDLSNQTGPEIKNKGEGDNGHINQKINQQEKDSGRNEYPEPGAAVKGGFFGTLKA